MGRKQRIINYEQERNARLLGALEECRRESARFEFELAKLRLRLVELGRSADVPDGVRCELLTAAGFGELVSGL